MSPEKGVLRKGSGEWGPEKGPAKGGPAKGVWQKGSGEGESGEGESGEVESLCFVQDYFPFRVGPLHV